MVGVLLLLLGMQFRMVDSFVLNETSTRVFAKFVKDAQLASSDLGSQMYMSVYPSAKKTVKPPNWLGLALLTMGGVICLHAMILPRGKG
jgi:hypothetical protein